ncbi:MAG: OmpA family protein [Gammaproteobacteria bacterium]|nr:OmpA family protein [Gammaproteobacteria bacterium]
MTELQAQLNELQADHEGLLQETIALRMLSESGETTEESAVASAEEIISRFPGGRESYLAARLKQAAKQLRRQRAQNRQLTLSLSEAGERNAANMVDSEERAALNEQLNGELVAANAESSVMSEESQSPVSAEERVSRFPYGRETYLATRLKHATRQIRRQRALNRHLASSLEEANERMAVKLSETDSLSSEKPVDSSSMTEEAQASVMAEDSRTPTVAERIASLQQELESANNEQQQLDTNLAVVESRIAGLEPELESVRSEQQQSESELSAATDQVTGLEQMLETARTERQRLDAELSVAQTRIASLEQQLENAKAQIQQTESEPSATAGQIAALEPELDIASDEKQRTVKEIERLTAQIDELRSGYDSERAYYERTIEGLVEKLNQAVALVAGSEDQGESATQMADSEETDSTQDQDSSETLLADRTSQLLARLSDLQERLSQTEVSASALSDAESRVAELDLQLSDSISQNVQMQEELINLTNQVDSLITELQAAERRTENMETLAQSITKENEQLGQLIGDLRKTMDISIAEKASEISELVSGYTVLEYSTDILFESGSAVLTEAGKEDLKEFAKSIESESFNNRVVSVEGHTDNVPIKGDLRIYYPTNWELSMARSAAATRYLVEQGVPADRLRAVGFGSRRPIEPNDTESGRRSNRRIEIHLVPELQKAKN